MALSWGTNIVTDGLTVYLDSHNSMSYPGSGATWKDLSGNGNDGTLLRFTGAGPGTTSGFDTNTGHMMFDRHLGASYSVSNNIVNIPSSPSLQQCLCENGVTIEYWLRMDVYYCTAIARWAGPWEIYYCDPLVFRTIGTGGNDGNSGYSYTNQLGKFHQIVATHDGTNRKLYVNNVNIYSGVNVVTNQDYTATLPVGGYASGAYAFYGAIPIFKLYNKALTEKELTQNYNALRWRFNL